MLSDEERKKGKILVSESGVSKPDDVKLLSESRADALLIGTVLMEADNPKKLVGEFKDVYKN